MRPLGMILPEADATISIRLNAGPDQRQAEKYNDGRADRAGKRRRRRLNDLQRSRQEGEFGLGDDAVELPEPGDRALTDFMDAACRR